MNYQAPRGVFYAEASVTNHASTSTDMLILAAYRSSGQMLRAYFLYTNPAIGQDFVLGASIDNTGGEVAQIRAFMLSMSGGVPLAEAKEFGG